MFESKKFVVCANQLTEEEYYVNKIYKKFCNILKNKLHHADDKNRLFAEAMNILSVKSSFDTFLQVHVNKENEIYSVKTIGDYFKNKEITFVIYCNDIKIYEVNIIKK